MSGFPQRVLLVTTIDGIGIGRLPRILSDAGCRTTLLSPPGAAIYRTRHAAGRITGSPVPVEMAGILRETLLASGSEFDFVILADEPLLWHLARSGREWMAPWFPLELGTDKTRIAFSKLALAQAAQERGVNVPAFEIVQNVEQAVEAARSYGYPAILKAEQGLAGSAVRIATDASVLRKQYDELSRDSEVMVQRYIAGDVGTSPVLFEHGRPACWFSAFLRENWPTPLSSSSAHELFDHPDIEPMLRAVGDLTGFNGLAGIDWVRNSATGRLELLELNPRPTPGMYLGPQAGVSFALAIQAWRAGDYLEQRPLPGATGTFVRMFPQNLYYAIQQRQIRHVGKVLLDAPWEDPALVTAHLRRLCTHHLPQPIRELGRSLRSRQRQSDVAPGEPLRNQKSS